MKEEREIKDSKSENNLVGAALKTKELLMDSARKIFLECGYQAAPLRKITAEAGFTPGALYGYFSSKEELFNDLTDPIADRLMEKLDMICVEMESIPKEKRLYQMGSIYYKNIPSIVELLLADKTGVKLIVDCSKGTKYESFLDDIAKRNTENLGRAAEGAKVQGIKPIGDEAMEVLMDGYIRMLFKLILSDKDKETIVLCMEMIGKIYERGIIALMQKGE